MKYYLLASIWIILIIVANPMGEFPLNDDWAYCKDVFLFFNTGRLEIVNWSAMTLVSQIYLGTFCCKIFGFSFTILRILTLFIGLIGILTSYKLLKDITQNDKIALFCTILIAINPLFFSLSNTFMTDVYFYTFTTCAIFFFRKVILFDTILALIMASIFITVAILIRQIGIVIPFSFAIVYLYKTKSIQINSVIKALSPLLLGSLFLYLFSQWAKASQPTLQTYISTGTALSTLGIKTFTHFFNRIGTTGMMLGLFLSPLLLLLLPNFLANFLKKSNRIPLLLSVLFIIPLIRAWRDFPLGNVLYNFGLGPKLLKDAEILKENYDFILNSFALNSIRAFCFVAAFLLFYFCFCFIINLIKQSNRSSFSNDDAFSAFSFLNLIFLFGTFIIPPFFFDRYLIQLMLPVMIILIPYFYTIKINLKNAYFSIAILLLIAYFSIAATHDYLAWNRARWQGLHYLMDDLKVSPNQIDGGFEFNGWYQTENLKGENDPSKSWWFVDKDNFILSFGPIEGYEIINKHPYLKYVTFTTGYVYVLKKINL